MNAEPIKYEVDKETGAMFVDRFMSTAMQLPLQLRVHPAHPVGRWRSGRCAGDSPPFAFEYGSRPALPVRSAMLRMEDEAGRGYQADCRADRQAHQPVSRCQNRRATLQPSVLCADRAFFSSTTRISSPASGVKGGRLGRPRGSQARKILRTASNATLRRKRKPQILGRVLERNCARSAHSTYLAIPFVSFSR